MIFNISQGGVAYLSVTAPSGATITASCQGLTVSGTGTCVLGLTIIGEWTITCDYSSITKTSTVTVTSYGETYTALFDYSPVIKVTTHPYAAVTAEKSGYADLTGAADSNGICELTVPYDETGVWSVTADNQTLTDTKSVDVDAVDEEFDVPLLENIPAVTFVIGGETYVYNGGSLDVDGVIKAVSDGVNSWKLWLYTTGTFEFSSLHTNIDLCLIGRGGNGGGYKGNNPEIGGGGGSGGEIKNVSDYTFDVGDAYSATIDRTVTSISKNGASVLSAANGNDGANGSAGGAGGAPVGGSGKGGDGSYHLSQTSGERYIAGDKGDDGDFAFGDPTFDGIRYSPGGGGGGVVWDGFTTFLNGATDGAAGGGGAGNVGTGNIGIIIMRNAS